mgnify:CR=1 FL=1
MSFQHGGAENCEYCAIDLANKKNNSARPFDAPLFYYNLLYVCA